MALCFFFQAEDGIRAGHVTGVQTCALPISSRNRASPACEPSARPTGWESELLVHRKVEAAKLTGASGTVANVVARSSPEIGRASCRERGKTAVGAGAGKGKRKRQTSAEEEA